MDIKIGYDASSLWVDVGGERFYDSVDNMGEAAELFSNVLCKLGHNVEIEECY